MGTRNYYAKLGYHLEKTYMVKYLKKEDVSSNDSDYDDEDY